MMSNNYKSFLDDKEKMRDFRILSKDEFLKSYSYITEQEYNLTLEADKIDFSKAINFDVLDNMSLKDLNKLDKILSKINY